MSLYAAAAISTSLEISPRVLQWNSNPLLAEEGWREAPGWSVRPKRFAGLLLRLRPVGLALRATPSAPSAHPPLLCEEGNIQLALFMALLAVSASRVNAAGS